MIAALGHSGGQGSSRVQPACRCGRRRVSRGQQPRGAEGDGAGRHRRRDRRLRATAAALARRRRHGRRRDQRRPAQPRAPVPVGPHQPARRRVGTGPVVLRARGARGGRAARRRRGASSGCACRATSWRRGRASCPRRRPTSRSSSSTPARSTTSRSSVVRSSRCRRPVPTAMCRRASTSTWRGRSAPRSTIRSPVIAQGSIVDVDQAEWAIGDGACDAVEMTRAQIADPDLGRKLAAGDAAADPAVHPVQPDLHGARRAQSDRELCRRAAHRATSGKTSRSSGSRRRRARRARRRRRASPGWSSRAWPPAAAMRSPWRSESEVLGGAVRVAAPGAGRERLAMIADWLEAECAPARRDVRDAVARSSPEDATDSTATSCCAPARGPGDRPTRSDGDATVRTAAAVLAGAALPEGAVAVWDPIGGPIGISVAETLARARPRRHLVTPDLIAGNELSRSGDLAPANVRLLSCRRRHREAFAAAPGGTAMRSQFEDRFTGELRQLPRRCTRRCRLSPSRRPSVASHGRAVTASRRRRRAALDP